MKSLELKYEIDVYAGQILLVGNVSQLQRMEKRNLLIGYLIKPIPDGAGQIPKLDEMPNEKFLICYKVKMEKKNKMENVLFGEFNSRPFH